MARFNMQKQKTLYFMLIANTEALTKLSPAGARFLKFVIFKLLLLVYRLHLG